MQGADVARALSDDLLPGRERDPVREASTPFDRACTLLCISEQSFVGKRIGVSFRAKGTAVTVAAVGARQNIYGGSVQSVWDYLVRRLDA